MLSVDDFRPVTLEDKPLFDTHYARYPPFHSDYMFTTMVSWMDYAKYYYVFLDDAVILMTDINDQIRFRPPLGKRSVTLTRQVLELAKKQDSHYPLSLIDVDTRDWLSHNFPKLQFRPHEDYFEYVYLSSDLADLPGPPYRKIRNRLNKFKKRYTSTIEEISEDNFNEIKKFLERWCLWRDCDSDSLLQAEKNAILYSMNHFFDLGLSGIAMRIEGTVEAIAVYEKMRDDMVVVHYEKGSPEYDGIYKAINAETAQLVQKDFKFINRESDMGVSGLRQAKQAYRPHHMVEVFHVDKEHIIV